MVEYKIVTGDDSYLELHQSTKSKEVRKYSTSIPLMTKRLAALNISPAVNVMNRTISSEALSSPANTSIATAPSPLVSTPSGKRKRETYENGVNTCRKCKVRHGSRTDNQFNSLWTNCNQRRCDYWVHLFCLGVVVQEKDEDKFCKLFDYYCPSHNPKHLPRSSTFTKKK